MTRPRGGYIGFNRVPAASAVSSAASGIWTLREAEALKRAGTWPRAPEVPEQISGLQLWLDASDATTLYDATSGGSLVAADGTVKRWEDKSGNARHATEATNGPQRKAAVQGGLDVLRFDGANDKLSIPSSTATFKFLHSTQATVFFVSKPTPATDDTLFGCLLANFSGSTSQIGYSLFYDDRTVPLESFLAEDELRCIVSKGSFLSVIDTGDSGAGLFTANEFTAASVVTDCTAASGVDRIAAFVNGADQQPVNSETNAASTSNSSGNLTIGSSSASTFFFPGDIAEIIIYDSALSDANRESVENYLLAKWGIT